MSISRAALLSHYQVLYSCNRPAYIWKDDIPSAIIYAPGTPSNTGTIERIVYLHPDHLNTPRKASDSQGRIVWSWESDAFGSTAPNEDVDWDVKTIINLRLPGQYFDAESGLHYNWHRYFDPQVGRFTPFHYTQVRLASDTAQKHSAKCLIFNDQQVRRDLDGSLESRS